MNARTRHERHHAHRGVDDARRRFELNGRERRGARRRDAASRSPTRKASRSRASATRTGSTRPATAARAWSRSPASACSRRRAAARRAPGMKVTTDSERAAQVAEAGARAAAVRHAASAVHAATASSTSGRRSSTSASRASRRARRSPRPVAPGDRGQPRRLHPVHALRSRLPRRAGQRRHRPARSAAQRSKIVFDMDDPMGASTCVACGECVQACPTGALMPARDVALAVPDKQVESVCPYLRRRLPAHLQRQGQPDPLRRRPRRPGEPRAACASRAATASTTRTTRSA